MKIAIVAAVRAGTKILEIYEGEDFELELKSDNSPLTKADICSNRIINDRLIKTEIPIISEENREIDFEQRNQWSTCWIVDPLDGTKEFIKRNGEFTVNIALVSQGVPVLGVIYVPVTRELYYAIVSEGSYKRILDVNHEINPDCIFHNEDRLDSLGVSSDRIRIVGSRSHMNEDTINFINEIKAKNKKIDIVSKGSSLKFCLVAEGKADLYPRFAPTMEWDTAAGHAICNAVGLKVISKATKKELVYNKPNLLNGHFLVTS